jgi:hypothetical protein
MIFPISEKLLQRLYTEVNTESDQSLLEFVELCLPSPLNKDTKIEDKPHSYEITCKYPKKKKKVLVALTTHLE